jgi:hypothetical protein
MIAHFRPAFLLLCIALLPAGVFPAPPLRAADFGPLPERSGISSAPMVSVPFDLDRYKLNWKKRIEAMKREGILPVIDIESSFDPSAVDAKRFAEQMDRNGFALVAFSPEVGANAFKKDGRVWSDAARRALSVDPWRYIPTTTGGIHPAWTERPEAFLEETIKRARAEGYPLLGEFEFRHYPSPRQLKRNEFHRDVAIPIDGPLGHRLFAYAEQTGIPFEIHYEIEDRLLPPLEEMLKRYPKAKVIWCHLAQIRYFSRSSVYGPEYVGRLIETHPNLYFDVAFGDSTSTYPGSGEFHARIWQDSSGNVKKEWSELIAKHPWRFLAALDLGGDRMDSLPAGSKTLRAFLEKLPLPAREIVAYKAAWMLLFNEELP